MLSDRRWISIGCALLLLVEPVQAQSVNDILNGINTLRQLGGAATGNRAQPSTAPPTSSVPARPGAQAVPLREIQTLLAQLGYDPGPIDGLMGHSTARAIRTFETDRGLAITGIPDASLLAALRAAATASPDLAEGNATSNPSFDCTRASSPTEQAICGSGDLAELDRAVARNYATAMATQNAAGRARLQEDQRTWIRQRDRCGADEMCLVTAMGQRSQALVVMAANAGDAAPQAPTPGGQTADAQQIAPTTLPAFGVAAPQATGPIFIAYVGQSTGVPRRWMAQEVVQTQREQLANLVYGAVAGTPIEERFLENRALAPEDTLSALREAGIEITDRLQNTLDRGLMRTPRAAMETVAVSVSANQFQMRRLQDTLNNRARAAMSAAQITSFEATVICGISVLDYDFNTGQFPFDPEDVARCFAGRPNAIGTVNGYQASFEIGGNLRPEGFAIPQAEAEALVSRLGGPRFALAVPARVTGRVQTQQNGQPLLQFTATPIAPMELRAGDALTEVVHRFDETALRDANDTPEARALTDFTRDWWLDNPGETAVILDRAIPAALSSLTVAELFDAEPALNLAVRLRYPEPAQGRSLTLADFLEQRSARQLQAIAASIGMPVETLQIVQLPANRNGGLGQVILVLPQAPQAYQVTAPLPAYQPEGGDYPGAHLRVDVTAERRVSLPTGEEILLFAGHPAELVVRRVSSRLGYANSPEITTIAFPRTEIARFETVRLAWRSDLVLSAAEILNMDPQEILVAQLDASRYAGNDAFAKRDAAASLANAARSRTGGQNLHWMQARVGLSAYDFERDGWILQSLSPALSTEASEADQSLRVELLAGGEDRRIFLPLPEDEARQFQAAAPSFPQFDALVAFRVDRVDTTYGSDFGSNLTLVYDPVELILFDPGRGQTVIDPANVRLRHRFAQSDAAQTAPDPAEPEGSAAMALPEGVFPVLGVTLGSDFDAAMAMLQDRMGPVQRYAARRETRQRDLEQWGGAPINDWDAFHNGILLESGEKQDMVAVYHEPPGAGSIVTAVSRTRIFAPGAGPSWPVLRDTILQTYPQVEPAQLAQLDQPDHLVFWNRPPHRPGTPVDPAAEACARSLNAMAGTLVTHFSLDGKARANAYLRPVDGRATWVDEAEAPVIPSVASPPPLPMLFGDSAACYPVEVMVIMLAYGDDGRVTEYRQAVTMPTQIAAMATQHKADLAGSASGTDFDL